MRSLLMRLYVNALIVNVLISSYVNELINSLIHSSRVILSNQSCIGVNQTYATND